MFCTQCGKPGESGANFCTYCGSRFATASSESSVFSGGTLQPNPSAELPTSFMSASPATPAAWPPQYRFAMREGEAFRFALDDVEIKMRVEIVQGYESKPPEKFKIPHLLVTDRRIVFLSKSERLFCEKMWFKRKLVQGSDGRMEPPLRGTTIKFADSIDFGPFWVLRRFLNEELHQEFISNPRGFSKAPFNAWWVKGLRDWIWVQNLELAGNDLRFGLVRIQALAMIWETGAKPVPNSHWEGWAQLSLGSSDNAARLKNYIEDAVKPEFGSPFEPNYIANLPVTPPSRGYVGYYYVFWTVLAVTIVVSILRSIGAPLYIAVPIVLVCCILTVRFLGRWLKRRSNAPTNSQP